MIMSYVGTNKRLQDAYLNGEVALELSPQGTIAERLRAGGAGMPGVFTRTGAGKSVFEALTQSLSGDADQAKGHWWKRAVYHRGTRPKTAKASRWC